MQWSILCIKWKRIIIYFLVTMIRFVHKVCLIKRIYTIKHNAVEILWPIRSNIKRQFSSLLHHFLWYSAQILTMLCALNISTEEPRRMTALWFFAKSNRLEIFQSKDLPMQPNKNYFHTNDWLNFLYHHFLRKTNIP